MADIVNFKPFIEVKAKARLKFCLGHQIEVDEETRTVRCTECGQEMTAWDALVWLAREESGFIKQLDHLQVEIEKLKAWNPRLVAVKKLHHVWASKDMIPTCPHCRNGVEAVDLSKTTVVSREYDASTKPVRLQRRQTAYQGIQKPEP